MSWPLVSIIVPIYRDTAFVRQKVINLGSQKYPKDRYEIILAHGGAKEDFKETVLDCLPIIKIVHTRVAGKTAQINRALFEVNGEVVVISDVDSVLDEDCLKEVVNAVSAQSVGVAGAWVMPERPHFFEFIYWKLANLHRAWESHYFSCSHVTAPCYAFRSRLIDAFPPDVVADDVFIALQAALSGWKVKYVRAAKAWEVRTPRRVRDLVQHKYRKGNAFLRELYRFLYRMPEMPERMRTIFFMRLFQFTFLTPAIFLQYPFFNQSSQFRKVRS